MDHRTSDAPAPDETEKQILRDLARGVIRAQGNTFIKELLREKGIRIGATKEDFERNLFAAIDNGQLRLADVEAWLEEVEGWGNQHVYLFNVSDELASTKVLSSAQAVRRKVQGTDLDEFWEAPISQAFPDALQLTSIRFDGQSLRLTWHEADFTWAREKEEKAMDQVLDIGLDHYELRAYRQVSRRSAMRFELRLKERLAGIFLSPTFDEKTHTAAITSVGKTLGQILDPLDVTALQRSRILIADVIKNLDQATTVGKKQAATIVRAQSTRFTGKSAYIELGSSSEEGSYLDDPTIGPVRQSIRGDQLSGATATFEILAAGLKALSQDVRLYLYGPQRRIRIRKLLKAEEVWAILLLLAKHQ